MLRPLTKERIEGRNTKHAQVETRNSLVLPAWNEDR